MPYLRFARDTRGYESTSVLHTFRRSGRNRSRILYWFRTPPGVKVGRAPLDEEAIREIEKHHPDLEFDWTKILETQPPVAPPSPRRAERRPRRGGRRTEPERGEAVRSAPQRERSRARTEPPLESSRETGGVVSDSVPTPVEPFVEVELSELAEAALGDLHESPLDNGDAVDADEASEEAAAFQEWEASEPAGHSASQAGAVEKLVGAEGLARLRARYAEIQARITERGGDPAETVELRRRAEALDPDTWVTSDEARLALEHYETRLEEFRRLLGPRRRRSRRGGRRRSGRGRRPANGPSAAATPGEAPEPGASVADGSDAGPEDSDDDPD